VFERALKILFLQEIGFFGILKLMYDFIRHEMAFLIAAER